MIFHDEMSAEDFSAKYGVPIERRECKNCRELVFIDRPIFIQTGNHLMAGFVQRDHGCGVDKPENYNSCVLVPANESALQFWNKAQSFINNDRLH
jgi:hypothetical protein